MMSVTAELHVLTVTFYRRKIIGEPYVPTHYKSATETPSTECRVYGAEVQSKEQTRAKLLIEMQTGDLFIGRKVLIARIQYWPNIAAAASASSRQQPPTLLFNVMAGKQLPLPPTTAVMAPPLTRSSSPLCLQRSKNPLTHSTGSPPSPAMASALKSSVQASLSSKS